MGGEGNKVDKEVARVTRHQSMKGLAENFRELVSAMQY